MAPSLTAKHSARDQQTSLKVIPTTDESHQLAPAQLRTFLSILATPPPILRTHLKSATEYFTPAFYDTLALFLHKHGIRYSSICLLGRGITSDEAQRSPAVIVKVYGDAGVVEHLRRLFMADEALVRMVPEEVKVVEFMGIVV